MNNTDYCKYVNVFHGCGEIDLPKPEGIAAKWFFIKAGCGNTSPAACVPFGAMSVSPYSGGYPTGYGDHKENSHSRPAHFEEGKGLLGFAHLQQSGTGAIGYYYNYALVTPKAADSDVRRIPEKEFAEPGYYSCFLDGIKCELTASKKNAYHRYTFDEEGGTVEIDFGNNGLRIPGCEKETVAGLSVCLTDGMISASAVIEGIKIYFAVSHNGTATIDNNIIIINNFGKQALLSVSLSLKSYEKATENLKSIYSFNSIKKQSYSKWNNILSGFDVEVKDEKIKRIFYSNLYHSLIKPCDWSGESFIYDDEDFCVDLATLWDMYKTALPLILLTQKDTGKKAVRTLINTSRALGEIPNSIGISDNYMNHSTQARMLGAYVLLTAYRYGIITDANEMLDAICKDAFSESKKDFTVDGKCSSYTFFLDMSDACALAAQTAAEIGRNDIYEKLIPLAKKWTEAYSPETGMLKDEGVYYEGSLYNYSFRQMVNMEERIELAGGKDKFVKLLDDFFGYCAQDVIQPTDPFNYEPVSKGLGLGRFEGFNNESDTEAPFSYIYAGRHDRTCEIIRSGMKYMFTEGRGGLPGNNDSGALSSYYIFATLGLFPVAGQNLFLAGSPLIDKANIKLFNGNILNISVKNNSDENIYVKSLKFNGVIIDGFRIEASELVKGGTIEFEMTNIKQ
ncbi:MAG: glycoside hydrolase family 92 protein [Clostridia bacterium]|nr:glycoside hydrolase family 92 protein [Clostridia bacterium]